MKSFLSKLLPIFILFVLSPCAGFSATSCDIKDTTFRLNTQCKDMTPGLKEKLDKVLSNLTKKMEKLIDKDDESCVPKELIVLFKNRFCGANVSPINVSCYELKEREKSVLVGYCQMTTSREYETYVTNPKAGTDGPNKLIVDPIDLAEMSVKAYEQTLFHEVIHIAENQYGADNHSDPHASNEDYTYTCTKRFYDSTHCNNDTKYPPSEKCPDKKVSNCIECDTYHPPKDPERKKR